MLAMWVEQLLGYAGGALAAIRDHEHYPSLMVWARQEGVKYVGDDLGMAQSLAPAPVDHSDITDEEMLTLFDQALVENPHNAELKTRYGNFLFNLKRYGEAIDIYRLALEDAPDDAVVRTDMGTAFYNLGRVDEAMANYERALESDPHNILALHNIAIAQLEELDNVAAAKETIRRIEGIDPNYPGIPSIRERMVAAGINSKRPVALLRGVFLCLRVAFGRTQ